MELLIGCGSNRAKKISLAGNFEWDELVTLDHEARHSPDIIHDLNDIPLPFDENFFDEIHAYECLEHIGHQGDWRFFFAQWADFWRCLKPGALFIGTVPHWQSIWALGDPSHTRVIPDAAFTFLHQPAYTAQVGISPMSDFRSHYKADFDIIHLQKNGELQEFILRAIKPSRISI